MEGTVGKFVDGAKPRALIYWLEEWSWKNEQRVISWSLVKGNDSSSLWGGKNYRLTWKGPLKGLFSAISKHLKRLDFTSWKRSWQRGMQYKQSSFQICVLWKTCQQFSGMLRQSYLQFKWGDPHSVESWWDTSEKLCLEMDYPVQDRHGSVGASLACGY